MSEMTQALNKHYLQNSAFSNKIKECECPLHSKLNLRSLLKGHSEDFLLSITCPPKEHTFFKCKGKIPKLVSLKCVKVSLSNLPNCTACGIKN